MEPESSGAERPAARHSTAIGYILDLARDADCPPWMQYIVDCAVHEIEVGDRTFIQNDGIAILVRDQQYRSVARDSDVINGSSREVRSHTTNASPAAPSANTHLQSIHSFRNFRGLHETLRLELDTSAPLSIIFGLNGSGKTSLATAIRLLSESVETGTPLNNVYESSDIVSSFRYRFQGDSADASWSRDGTNGPCRDQIRFFNSQRAVRLIQNGPELDDGITARPFSLEVYDVAGELINNLEEACNSTLEDRASAIRETERQCIEVCRNTIDNLVEDAVQITAPLMNLEGDPSQHQRIIAMLEIVNSSIETQIKEIKEEIWWLERMLSPEGISEMEKECQLILILIKWIEKIRDDVKRVTLRDLLRCSMDFISRHQMLVVISSELFPKGVSQADFEAMIVAANRIVNLLDPKLQSCPLCKSRVNNEDSDAILRQYGEYIQKYSPEEVARVYAQVIEMLEFLSIVRESGFPNEIDVNSLHFGESTIDGLGKLQALIEAIPNAMMSRYEGIRSGRDKATPAVVELIRSIPQYIDDERIRRFDDQDSIASCLDALYATLHERRRILDEAKNRVAQIEDRIKKLKEDLLRLRLEQLVINDPVIIKTLLRRVSEFKKLRDAVSDAKRAVQRKRLTESKTMASTELVIGEFEQSLSDEVKALCGKDLSSLGVSLRGKGRDQKIRIDLRAGGVPADKVLSDGEQRMLALALFLTEARTQRNVVFVLDDPVTSFDYNHCGTFCERLRSLVAGDGARQLIVLTHNWEFFVTLQQTMGRRLNNKPGPQLVLIEGCSTIGTWQSRTDETIDKELRERLGRTQALTLEDRHWLAAEMRRLIEAIISRYVFAGQRQQFIQSTPMRTGTFGEFRRLVPLLDDEALELKDLYSKLSPWQHDDPRTSYIESSREQISEWRSKIVAIRDSVMGRRKLLGNTTENAANE